MVSAPHQCPGIERIVCNRFLPSKENDPHCLCVSVVVSPASSTIGVGNATTGVMIAAIR